MAELLDYAKKGLLYLASIYTLLIILLMTPWVQRQFIYLHAIRIPLRPQYDSPEEYGLAPGKTLNLNLVASDGVKLGAWFIAADGFYQKHIKALPPVKIVPGGPRKIHSNSSPKHPTTYVPRRKLASVLPLALQTHPTILYFHGNSMTRVYHTRIRLYSALTSRLHANVLVIDYRGFGDSEGTPSEEGLLLDARAAWDWLIGNGVRPKDITVLGESLGTGVSTGLVAGLAREGVSPRGLVLLAAYSSITKLVETYSLGGKVPFLWPIQLFGPVFDILIKGLRHRFDSLSIINNITCQITIIHALDDWHIPISHARALFDALLEPLVLVKPLSPNDAMSNEARNIRRKELLAVRKVEGLGIIQSFERGKSKGSVRMLETTWGGHKWIRNIEGVVDVIGWSVGTGESH